MTEVDRGVLTAIAATGMLWSSCTTNESVISDAPQPDPPVFAPAIVRELSPLVDPRIGTEGPGNVVPGALVPHGVVRASPMTDNGRATVDAYRYESDRIVGFTHTHLSGPGGTDYGYSQLSFMPTAAGRDLSASSASFDHRFEQARPGYYQVLLDDSIDVELTATGHASVHRYTFSRARRGRVWVDLGRSSGATLANELRFVGDRAIEGSVTYNVSALRSALLALVDRDGSIIGESTLYFYVEFDQPFEAFGIRLPDGEVLPEQRRSDETSVAGWVDFELSQDERVEARVGISFLDRETARENLRLEVGSDSFDRVAERADLAWNRRLNRIQIEGGDELQRVFYTALYHAMFQPSDHSEAHGGRLIAAGGFPRVAFDERSYYSDDWCMWDTFRTTHPLGALIEPEIRSDVVHSLLAMESEAGVFPRCTWQASGLSRVMTGNHAIAIIADAWAKGFRNYDESAALEALVRSSRVESDPSFDGFCGELGIGVPRDYLTGGFVGYECDRDQAASMTLEHAIDDASVALVADGLGRSELAQEFWARARNYRNQWDEESGFFRPRQRDGSWVSPFDPRSRDTGNGFTEGTAWTYLFYVLHDVEGLMDLMGGADALAERLDAYFASGLYDPTNQPSFHIPWLYNRVGRPDRAHELVRAAALNGYTAAPDGLPGNDDAGSTSAWFVFAALGLYPVFPAEGRYEIGVPLVERATIHLNPDHYAGETFTIEVGARDADDRQLAAIFLNGDRLDRFHLLHEELAAGGTLRIELGPRP